MTAPIELYYWPTPNGWKITIALEEMGLPYDIRWIDINAGDQFDPDFLKIAPNNRMPAITDPEGPDGAPVSIFESGAILQYLARKTGRFTGATERERIAVDQWLMWQMGGLGPMAGQANHFIKYGPKMEPPQVLPYAQNRYRTEVGRLYKVLDRKLGETRFVATDAPTIADFAIWPWSRGWESYLDSLDGLPNFARWLDEMWARPAVRKGYEVGLDRRNRKQTPEEALAAQKILYGQTG